MSDNSKPAKHLTKIRDFWNEHARWDAHTAICSFYESHDKDTRDEAFDEFGIRDAAVIAPFLRPDSIVVDLGCGIGRVVRHVAPHCKEVIGVDISEEMIAKGTEYLSDCKNARLIRTEGSDLKAFEPESIDLLYSLLVLIHVDRRSFYRYLREMKRVIKPDGMVFLQFQNILSEEGITKFEGVLDMDIEYPLEFYTLEELKTYCERQGFEVINHYTHKEYIFLSAIKGDAKAWLERETNGAEIKLQSQTGSLSEGEVSMAEDGELCVSIRSSLNEHLGYTLFMAAVPADGSGEFYHSLSAPLSLVPEADLEVVVRYDSETGKSSASIGGKPLALQATTPCQLKKTGPGFVVVGLVPPGFYPTEDVIDRFSELSISYSITVL